MSKVKLRVITIISFIAAICLALGFILGFGAETAYAAEKTYLPSSIFASDGTKGEVGVSQTENEDETAYVQFTFQDGGKTYFRRNLALRWFEREAADDQEDESEPEGQAEGQVNSADKRYLTFTLSFPEVSFDVFEITFESTEENISKDGKSVNSIVFFHEEDKLFVAVKDAQHQDVKNEEIAAEDKTEIADKAADLKFSLDEIDCNPGEFNLNLGGNKIGAFVNVGGYYLEYRSSTSSTPSTPITFTAQLSGEDAKQTVLVKELNGQTFEVTDGNVKDNARPVLVPNEEIYAFTLGQRFNLSYQAIDVCDDYVDVTRTFYMLKYDEEGNPKKPNEETDDDYKTLNSSTCLLPTTDTNEQEREYVSIRFKLNDGAYENYFVYLTWYAADKEGVVETLGEGENAFDYILVDREKGGPSYTGITANEGTKTNDVSAACENAVAAYREELEKASKDLSAGSGAYIYLPSMRGLFESNYSDYRNLHFSIYYKKQSMTNGSTPSSQVSLSYNSLKLEIDERGDYVFRVLATDSNGDKSIRLYLNGELVDVDGDNIWEIDEIPQFSFTVGYTGVTVEDVTKKDAEGHRDSTYTFDRFTIIGLSGYETKYTLYRFDSSKLPEGESIADYNTFVENLRTYTEDEKYKDCFIEITEYNDDVKEGDDAWDRTDNDYNWKPSSSTLSFMPKVTGYYVLRVDVTDAQYPGLSQHAYQTTNVRNSIDTIPAQSQWAEENVLSIVLFAISGVLAIVIVILFVVKPSDKKVEEIDLEKLKGNKKDRQDK